MSQIKQQSKSMFNDMVALVRSYSGEQVAGNKLKMYSFKNDIIVKSVDELETVIARSIDHAIEQRPDLRTWILHSVTP